VVSDEITRLLAEWDSGDQKALDKLIPLVYSELRRTADRYLRKERQGHTLQPTALVHETYLRLAKMKEVPWRNRAHFFAAAAQIMRHLLVNHALAKKASKRGGGYLVTLTEAIGSAQKYDWDVQVIHEALNKLALVDPRKSKIVELRFFAGVTNEEIAEILEISLTTVNRDWRMARAWLYSELSS
jgi:RNA polymerase sigma factor (TIGR02999 family)